MRQGVPTVHSAMRVAHCGVLVVRSTLRCCAGRQRTHGLLLKHSIGRRRRVARPHRRPCRCHPVEHEGQGEQQAQRGSGHRVVRVDLKARLVGQEPNR